MNYISKSRIMILFLISLLLLILNSMFVLGAIGDNFISGWSFDSEYHNGTGVIDVTGNNSGIIRGTVTNQTECIVGECLTFDGTDDYIDLQNNDQDFNLSDGSFTVSFWARTTNIDTARYIFAIGNLQPLNEATFFGFSGDSGDFVNPTLRFSNTGGEWVLNDNVASPDITINAWSYWVYVKNGTDYAVYTNTSTGLVKSNQATANGKMFFNYENQTGKYRVTIGGGFYNDMSFNAEWTGDIDELMIWKRALDNSEFEDLYENKRGVTYVYSVTDTTSPTFDERPNNVSLSYNFDGLNLNINASDETGFDRFFINDTTNFNISHDGNLKNMTTLGKVKWYINVSINDTSNNQNSLVLEVNVTNTQPTITINSPADNDHNSVQLTAGFTVEDVNGDSLDVSLYINGTVDDTDTGLSNGTTSTLSSVSLTNGHWEWSVRVCDPDNSCENSTARTYIYDDINPVIEWYNPLLVHTSSKNILLSSIYLSDVNLWMFNYSIYHFNESLLSWNSTLISGNISWNVNDSVSFGSDGNYSIEMCVSDSHTFGTLDDLVYSIDSKGITFFKGLVSKRLYFGYFNSGTYNFLTNELIDYYDISSYINEDNGEYKWHLQYNKPSSDIIFGFAIEDDVNLYLINEDIGHFVWKSGKRGWYFDFIDLISSGYELSYVYKNVGGKYYHIIYTDTGYCQVEVGEQCII